MPGASDLQPFTEDPSLDQLKSKRGRGPGHPHAGEQMHAFLTFSAAAIRSTRPQGQST